MKKFLAMILATLMILTLASCTGDTDETGSSDTQESESVSEGTQGIATVAGKTPKELYNAAVAEINAMTNYQLKIIDYTTTSYLDESYVDTYTSEYKTDGISTYYTYQDYKIWFVDEVLYTQNDISNEKVPLDAQEFANNLALKKKFIFFPITDEYFNNSSFVKDGALYRFNFSMTAEEYKKYTGQETKESVDCSAAFNASGAVVSFDVTTYYVSAGGIEVAMKTTYEFEKIGGVETVSAPVNADEYRTPLKFSEIDMSLLADGATVTPSDEMTDYVKLDISGFGEIIIRLYPDVAPKTVENFKKLVADGEYDGLIFHRVIKDFVVQGGDPDGDGTGGVGDPIVGEFTNNGFTNNLSHQKGVVSMARLSNNANSATSQFFIVQGEDCTSLDDNYAAFGYVVFGIDVVDAIAAVETSDADKPLVDVVITSATFVTVS